MGKGVGDGVLEDPKEVLKGSDRFPALGAEATFPPGKEVASPSWEVRKRVSRLLLAHPCLSQHQILIS